MDHVLSHLKTDITLRWDNPPARTRLLLAQISECATPNLLSVGGPGGEVVNHLLRTDTPLDWQAMCTAQTQILELAGSAADFRKTRAYACGLEREYIFFDGLDRLFAKKIAHDADSEIHPFIKAARIYMDIIFVHPFEDGNARAAKLWFNYHTARAQLFNPDFVAIRRLPKKTGDGDFYWKFVDWCAQSTLSRMYNQHKEISADVVTNT